jgi:hypothetical protein
MLAFATISTTADSVTGISIKYSGAVQSSGLMSPFAKNRSGSQWRPALPSACQGPMGSLLLM